MDCFPPRNAYRQTEYGKTFVTVPLPISPNICHVKDVETNYFPRFNQLKGTYLRAAMLHTLSRLIPISYHIQLARNQFHWDSLFPTTVANKNELPKGCFSGHCNVHFLKGQLVSIAYIGWAIKKRIMISMVLLGLIEFILRIQ